MKKSGVQKAAILFWLLFIVPVLPAFAGFNDNIDIILQEENITYGQASYLLLTGAELIEEDATFDMAAEAMSAQVPGLEYSSGDPLNMGTYAYMIMETFELSGGLFYRIASGPRYALRELRFKKIIQGKTFVTTELSGFDGMHILGKVLEYKETK